MIYIISSVVALAIGGILFCFLLGFVTMLMLSTSLLDYAIERYIGFKSETSMILQYKQRRKEIDEYLKRKVSVDNLTREKREYILKAFEACDEEVKAEFLEADESSGFDAFMGYSASEIQRMKMRREQIEEYESAEW